MTDHARWETRFSAPGYLFGKEPNAFLKAQASRFSPGMRALAVADGEGRNGVWLAERGLNVLAIDFSETALAKARALADERGVRIATEAADISSWRWPHAAYDVIASIFVHLAGAERDAYFGNLKVALKPGGLLLMESYRPEQLNYRTGGPPDAARTYTRALLQAAFADFSELDIREHDSIISEGTAHVGMSALIDLVGKK